MRAMMICEAIQRGRGTVVPAVRSRMVGDSRCPRPGTEMLNVQGIFWGGVLLVGGSFGGIE